MAKRLPSDLEPMIITEEYARCKCGEILVNMKCLICDEWTDEELCTIVNLVS